ncbi:putative ABC transporter-associated repeat protein [Lentzea flaviverrucosa]|uniref:Putative ABC transporter-associated repeat protein n=2 Tax=Lentzea flaviverrucosa TaxID=200379 RepID=A0A1H9F5T8_9PSEU|nr:putative ABC transporter-associated repeat protein [Lentzea flaviverrucosa]SEQ33354.1 putative ABC transporter-associated repeat protein [Lentzea flaviverrucosa]
MLVPVLAMLLAAQPAAVAQEAERVVIEDGHVDLGPRFVEGKWTVQLRDDTGDSPQWRALSDVVLHVPDTAKTTVPDDQAYSFLGDRGSGVWVLPQVEQSGVVWPGWNTQDPEVAKTVDREVTWRLHGVRGPGRFALFLTGNFGAPQQIFTSTDSAPQETGVEVGTHVHGNWVFGAPGTYLLDIEMSTRAKDRRELTDRQALRIHVGNTDPRTAFDVAAAQPEQQTAQPLAQSAGFPWQWIGLGGLALVVVALVVVVRRRRGER